MNSIAEMNLCGGRGKCPYCKEMHNNVAFHEAWECPKNPNSQANKNLKPLIKAPEQKSAGLQLFCDGCNKTPFIKIFSPEFLDPHQ